MLESDMYDQSKEGVAENTSLTNLLEQKAAVVQPRDNASSPETSNNIFERSLRHQLKIGNEMKSPEREDSISDQEANKMLHYSKIRVTPEAK